jgi:hypothetical protein
MDLWQWLHGAERDRPFVGFASAYGVLWEMGFLLLVICWYALFAYPRLSPAFGGGRPTEIILVVNPALSGAVRSSGIPVGLDGRTPVLRLLFEDSTNFFLEAGTPGLSGSVRVRKVLVVAAVHIRDPAK